MGPTLAGWRGIIFVPGRRGNALLGALCLFGAASCTSDGKANHDDQDAGPDGPGGSGGTAMPPNGGVANGGGAENGGVANGANGGVANGGTTSSHAASGATGNGGAHAASGGSSNGGTPAGSGGASGTPPSKPVPFTCSVTPSKAPDTVWKNVTANLAGMPSECGNLTLAAADPCSDRVIVGVAKGGLWATITGGTTWEKLGSGAGSATIVHRPSSIVFDPEHPDVFYESGIYGNLDDGLYKTTDAGKTFTKLGKIGHNDLISVDFTDPDRKTLLAGSHETKQRLYLSKDGGATWTDIGMRLPAGSHFSSAPLVLDASHFLLGACGWGDGTCGVYASNDVGQTWDSRSTQSPAGRPLWAADGHLLWPTLYDSGLITSSDDGATWSAKMAGPHTGFPAELPDGRVVAVGGDHLIITEDSGKTWSNIGQPLPYAAAGVTYSTGAKAFYVWRNDCGGAVLPDAVMSAGFDG